MIVTAKGHITVQVAIETRVSKVEVVFLTRIAEIGEERFAQLTGHRETGPVGQRITRSPLDGVDTLILSVA